MHSADNSIDPVKAGHDSSRQQSILRGVFRLSAEGMLTALLRERETKEDRIPHLLSEIVDEAAKQFPRWIGQVAIISQISTQYREEVHSYLARIVGDAQTADDLTQDTFIKAMIAIRKGGDVPAASRTKPWLFMIGINLVRDAVRKSRARRERPLEGVDEAALVAKALPLEARFDVREVLDRVKCWCGVKAAEIAKSIHEGCSKEEIATRQQISKRTVERYLRDLAAALSRFAGKSERG
jgi:RNA polymerase sigma factor (sigma-70 family)